MDRAQFEELVRQALTDVPHEFAEKLDNVTIVVEDEPSLDQITRVGIGPYGLLFGLYEGVPKTKRVGGYAMVPPDKITIFQNSIEYVCRTNDEIKERIRTTVLHEVGHHFGLSEKELRSTNFGY